MILVYTGNFPRGFHWQFTGSFQFVACRSQYKHTDSLLIVLSTGGRGECKNYHPRSLACFDSFIFIEKVNKDRKGDPLSGTEMVLLVTVSPEKVRKYE